MQTTSGPMEGTATYSNAHERRSVSGTSTHSQDSSMTHDFQYQHQPRYAPIRPISQPIGQAQEGFPIAVQSFGNDHESLHHIQQYNTSQDPSAHSQAITFQHNHQFAPYDASLQANAFPTMSPGLPESRPGSRQRGPSVGSVSLPLAEADSRTKKQASANAANERELRELIEKNSDRTLESIAKDVRGSERTQKAERAKQLFAMRWLKQFCKIDKESVPRNRVYTHYTQRCGAERVDTLNPASFGKLVRVIFPGIQTRRLGVRGESKYHYVNLALTEDPAARGSFLARPPSASNATGLQTRETSVAPEAEPSKPEHTRSNSLINRPSTAPSQTAPVYAVQQQPASPDFNAPILDAAPNPSSSGQLFADPSCRGFHHRHSGPQMYEQQLRFSNSIESSALEGALEIPMIASFLPPRADEDLAENLEALYRTHCTSLIDAVRFVREKQFFKLLTGFNGQMTVPVSKLFSTPSVATWIRQCDLIMYQQIVRFVSQLALQVIPPQVHSMLNRISEELSRNMRTNFKNYPPHVLQAKLEPGTVFCSLLKRLIRVNETAHAAANLLMNDGMRNMMWQDWVRCVEPKRVIETELQLNGREETYTVLTRDVHRLLEPLQSVDWTDMDVGSDFHEEVYHSYHAGDHVSAEGILEKWATFLQNVPSRFSSCPTRKLLHSINAVGTAALRDITVGQAGSFGGWWITKVWVDEMMLWLAESGGFLDPEKVGSSSLTQHASFDDNSEITDIRSQRPPTFARSQTAMGGLGINFQTMPTFEPPSMQGRASSGPPTANFRLPPRQLNKHDHFSFDINNHHDEDSGIGLMDDSEHHSFMNGHHGHIDEFASLLS